jgi:hypothetical protein
MYLGVNVTFTSFLSSSSTDWCRIVSQPAMFGAGNFRLDFSDFFLCKHCNLLISIRYHIIPLKKLYRWTSEFVSSIDFILALYF